MLVTNKIKFLKKNFKFVLHRENNIIVFNLSFMLLLIEINFIAKK